METYKMPLIGEKAPEFRANTTYGPVNFPSDFKGKWVIFFSHPGDFTPVCTTEIMTFAAMKDRFAAKNAALLGLSVDSNPSHIAWVRAMGTYSWNGIDHPQVTFPIVADDFGNVARLYGMLMPAVSTTKTVRSVFVIDPDGVIRAILSYPLSTGRNMDEIYRLLLALQAYDETGDPTPADWQPGEAQILPPPQTVQAAAQRPADPNAVGCVDWYLCFTQPGAAPARAAERQMTPQRAPSARQPVQAMPPVQPPRPVMPPMQNMSPVQNMPPVQNVQPMQPVIPAVPSAQPSPPAGTQTPVPQNPAAAVNPPRAAVPMTPQQAAEQAVFGLPGQPSAYENYLFEQPGRPFVPDGMDGAAGRNMTPPRSGASIMDQNRDLLGLNRRQSGQQPLEPLTPRDGKPKRPM